MTISVTITKSGVTDQFGRPLTVGTTYALPDDLANSIVSTLRGSFASTYIAPDENPPYFQSPAPTLVDGDLNYSDGSVLAVSEVSAYVNMTATGTAFTGACEFAGYICTVAAGNITVYDNTAASGTVIVPTTALAAGPFPIFGAGTDNKLALVNGCHVVLSGAATVNVLVQ